MAYVPLPNLFNIYLPAACQLRGLENLGSEDKQQAILTLCDECCVGRGVGKPNTQSHSTIKASLVIIGYS